MDDSVATDDLLRRYLLGLLVATEQERLEMQLLTENGYLQELSVAEDELIDSYVRGSLSDTEIERFQHHFLAAPDRKRKLSFAQSLYRYVAASSSDSILPAGVVDQRVSIWRRLIPESLHSQPPLAVPVAVVLLIIVLGGLWLTVRNVWVRDQTGNGPDSSALVISLRPGVARDTGETTRITIPAGVSKVQLQLALTRDEHQNYLAVITTDDEKQVLSADKLRPDLLAGERVITLTVRAAVLSPGDYHVSLSGLDPGGQLEEIGKYHFRVIANFTTIVSQNDTKSRYYPSQRDHLDLVMTLRLVTFRGVHRF